MDFSSTSYLHIPTTSHLVYTVTAEVIGKSAPWKGKKEGIGHRQGLFDWEIEK